jgi:hypothetical protein
MLLGIFQWVVMVAAMVFHPFYVSVIEIEHNAADKSVEISVRIFSDDLEKTLQKYSQYKVDLSRPADSVALSKQIAAYLRQTIVVKANGQTLGLQYLGYERNKESVWCYLESPGVTQVQALDIDCSLLHDYNNGQINIFHVKNKGVEKSYKLDYPQRKTRFEF